MAILSKELTFPKIPNIPTIITVHSLKTMNNFTLQ